MPIYEYACTPCARSFEELVIRKSDEAEVRCPTCGSPDVARQMSRPASVGGGGGGEPYGGGRSAPSCGPIG
ncbi:MAG: zinc ribbon domain-containing protein [Anaeromyxobacteraceae bacterium]